MSNLDDQYQYEQEIDHDDVALLQMDSLMQTPMIKDKPAAPSTLGRHNGGNSFDLLMDNLNFQDERSRIVSKNEITKQ